LLRHTKLLLSRPSNTRCLSPGCAAPNCKAVLRSELMRAAPVSMRQAAALLHQAGVVPTLQQPLLVLVRLRFLG
jgi:hypothetical protein